MNHTFLPIIINDNHNKSTQDLLHNIILNNSALSDKYKSLTIINNTINYNNNINNYNDNLFKDDEKNNNLNTSLPLYKNKITNENKSKEYHNDTFDDNDFYEINKTISFSEQKKEIENLKKNLKNKKNFKEAENIQNAKSISSREREINGYNNKDIISSDNIIVNIEEISYNKIKNDENSLTNKYNLKSNNENESEDKSYINQKNQITNINSSQNNIYEINYDSPNKNANLVKKEKKYKFNSNLKSKNEEDIIKLYHLNDTISNDVIFIFVNEETTEGARLLNLVLKYFVQNINNKQISIYVFDMNNKTDNNKLNEGIEILLTELQLHKIIKLVLCCGDESFFPFINKLHEFSVNFEKIIFCVLPFGRTNDLSTQFGFGNSLYSNINLKTLKKIIQDVLEATSVHIDIWEVKITCDENNGGYISINNNFEKCKKKISTIRRGFISYFSLGYDSRIGFAISKKKSLGCRCCNIFNFWWEGMKKSCCTKSIKLNQFVEALYYINLQKNESLYDDSGNEDNQTIKEDNGRKITIFQTCKLNENDNISVNNSKSDNRISSSNDNINKKTYNKSNAIPADEVDGDEEFNKKSENIDIDNNIENEESESEYEYEEVNKTLKRFKCEKILIKGEPLGLICQNIKYFCDGNISKWETKKPSYGIQTYKNNKILSDSTNKYIKELKKVSIKYLIYLLYLYLLLIGKRRKGYRIF